MGRGVVALACTLLFAGGCIPYATAGRLDPALARRLFGLRASMGGSSGRARTTTLSLRYDIDGWDGHWTDEIVVAPDRFVERRRRVDGTAGALTFGEDAAGSFVRAAEGPWRAADGTWRAEARTRRALFGAEFLAPEPGDDAELVGRYRNGWEYSFHAVGARTITLDVSAATGLPTAFDYGDGFGRLVTCEDVEWTKVDGRPVPRSGRCFTGIEAHGRAFRFALAPSCDPRARPAFADVAAWRGVSVPATTTQVYPLAGTGRAAIVPVVLGDTRNAPERFIVDTGAWWTTVDEEVAERDGIVPTGEVPIYEAPPWLPRGEAWVGVADHVRVAGADLVGVRVLVMEGLARGCGSAGLLGANVLSQRVVDFDVPHHELRFVPEEAFRADEGAFHYALRTRGGHGASVPGAIAGLGRGQVMLDTGAETTMVVFAPGVAAVYPRRRGADARFGANDETASPDYWTNIDGAQLGPFALPAMHVAARDRELEGLPNDLAIVGMGVMRLFRIAFDFHRQELYVWPTDAYHALERAGIEVVDAHGDGARIITVARRTPAADARLFPGDRIVAIDDAPVMGADQARRLLADHRGAPTRLRVWRDGHSLEVPLALEPRTSDCSGPGDPFCPQSVLALSGYDAG